MILRGGSTPRQLLLGQLPTDILVCRDDVEDDVLGTMIDVGDVSRDAPKVRIRAKQTLLQETANMRRRRLL